MIEKLLEMPKYEVYKDSALELLGEIPEHWQQNRFKFIGSSSKGKLPKRIVSVELFNTPAYMTMDYLRGGYANQWVLDSSLEVIKSDEILLLWDGSNSGEFIKSRIGIISSTVALITFRGISKQFGWYFSSVIERRLRASTVGMGIPHINGQELLNCEVLIPPLSEQIAITGFLDHKTKQVDQAIAIKEKQITLLKERKQILIQNAVTRGLNPDAPMRNPGVDWLGEIPAHWQILANRAILKERVQPGEEGLPLLSVSIHTAVSTEEISDEENIRGRIKIEDKTKYNLVEPGDIVFNMMRAWQGAIGAVKIKGMVSPAYIIATPNKRIIPAYFEYQYRCPEFIQQMDRNSKGITDFRKRLYWGEFKQLMTVVPPIDEQKTIVTHIETQSTKIDQAISIQQQQIEKLKEYKTTLINSAVTGKIKVA